MVERGCELLARRASVLADWADRMPLRNGYIFGDPAGGDAAADGNGAWIVSTHPLRLFYRDQAITALTLAERLAAGFGDDDSFVKSWRKELFL